MDETRSEVALRQTKNCRHNQSNKLAAKTSYADTASRCLVILAAILLIASSAGFGALFAWRTGSRHDVLLGGLSVAMAVGLELTKPFAISSAFVAFRCFRIVTGGALFLVGLLAVAYSLQAELAFMATTRSDLVAERAGDANAAERAQDRYDAAAKALATLQPTGTSKTATTAYLGRREALAAELRAAELDRRNAPAAIVVDPGATALAVYATSLGWEWDAEELGTWLPLIGVLALEIGSAFGIVLVRSVNPVAVAQVAQAAITGHVAPHEQLTAVNVRKQPAPPDHGGGQAGTSSKAGVGALIEYVRANGGAVELGQRKLARQLGASRTSLQRAMKELAETGAVVLSSSANGTRVALV